jgi:hypothetical protein
MTTRRLQKSPDTVPLSCKLERPRDPNFGRFESSLHNSICELQRRIYLSSGCIETDFSIFHIDRNLGKYAGQRTIYPSLHRKYILNTLQIG